MKHLVLGSRGQVGQYVTQEIQNRGDSVIEWDIVISQDHDLRVGSNKLIEAMAECDYVHFLASDVGGSKYLAAKQDSFDFIQNNVLLMDNVFSALKVTKKPFYYTSSQMSTMGHSVYGRLKAVGEAYTKSLGGSIIWFWNVFGLETDPNKAHVVTDFIEMAWRDGRILCRTDGTEKRQFVYGKDIARILYDHAFNDIKSVTPIQLTSGEWISIRDLAQLIAKLFIEDDIQIYYSDKVDKVQGILNEPDEDCVLKYARYFNPLEVGLSDLIKEMFI
jgi:nucleoside-diphosphate-sugar epimerase